mmetsp:Transcript_11807/g.34099  ORF Transcript_11807/g.34099 Transcript_11807/m.34099 type:complete len:234 (+) Transcript_11807:287-988(+)
MMIMDQFPLSRSRHLESSRRPPPPTTQSSVCCSASAASGNARLSPTPPDNRDRIIPNDTSLLSSNPKYSPTSFPPTNPRIKATAGGRKRSCSTATESTEKRLRRLRMAKIFEVKTMNGSSVMPKTAGTESTANTMSVSSMQTSTSSKGVALRTPSTHVKNRSPSYESVAFTILCANFTTWFPDKSSASSSSPSNSNFALENKSTPPNTRSTACTSFSAKAPNPMNMPRRSTAP